MIGFRKGLEEGPGFYALPGNTSDLRFIVTADVGPKQAFIGFFADNMVYVPPHVCPIGGRAGAEIWLGLVFAQEIRGILNPNF